MNIKTEKVLQKTEQLKKKNTKLKRIIKLKTQFISNASHEIRTPLTIAKLNLEFFKSQYSYKDKSLLKILDSIDCEINKVTDTLSDLTLLTSIDEKSLEKINIIEFDLNKLIFAVVERARILAQEKKMKIFFDETDDVIKMQGDKSKIEKLFLNIIRNSIKYGKRGGWIKIQMCQDMQASAIKVRISDNGVGIAPEDMPFIFDRFYRGDLCHKRGEGGFGLGLSICKWIAEKHNGTVAAESTLDKGSTFSVTLPLAAKSTLRSCK